ncbi:TPA: hypothetical protein I9590_002775 [Clostridioides difficile]|nr:hypothetical protein QO7_2151 [Clostridioides difficile F314]HAT4782594.1 hypothetical protein [Clostridioides difficile]
MECKVDDISLFSCLYDAMFYINYMECKADRIYDFERGKFGFILTIWNVKIEKTGFQLEIL